MSPTGNWALRQRLLLPPITRSPGWRPYPSLAASMSFSRRLLSGCHRNCWCSVSIVPAALAALRHRGRGRGALGATLGGEAPLIGDDRWRCCSGRSFRQQLPVLDLHCCSAWLDLGRVAAERGRWPPSRGGGCCPVVAGRGASTPRMIAGDRLASHGHQPDGLVTLHPARSGNDSSELAGGLFGRLLLQARPVFCEASFAGRRRSASAGSKVSPRSASSALISLLQGAGAGGTAGRVAGVDVRLHAWPLGDGSRPSMHWLPTQSPVWLWMMGSCARCQRRARVLPCSALSAAGVGVAGWAEAGIRGGDT